MATQSDPPVGPEAVSLVPAAEPSPTFAPRPDYQFVRTLLTLQHKRASGILRVEAEGGVVTAIRLTEGSPVFVAGGLPADSLGRLLVKQGKISEATLAQVEEERMLLQGRMRFGEVAQRLGVLCEEALAEALREQVRDKLARCLHWEYSKHSFTSEPSTLRLPGAAPLAVEPLLLYGVSRHFSLERTRELLSGTQFEHPVLRGSRRQLIVRFGLSELDQRALDLIIGAPSLAHLLSPVSEEELRAIQLLAVLALTDQLRLSEPEGPEESGPFVIDDLPRARGRSPSRPDASGLVITGARASPAPPAGGSGELPGKEKLLADSAFLQGKELLRAGEYGAAADAFREASNLRPTALEYALFAAWSAYLSTGRAQKWRQMLVELCERTLSQDRHLAFAYHVQGQLALESRDLRTAQAALSRALELDPQDHEARALLAKIQN